MNIEYSRNFKKSYKKLDIFIQQKIKERIRLFEEDTFHPLLHNHSIHPTFILGRSINITGDYRAIYIEHGATIIFVKIGTHSELYA